MLSTEDINKIEVNNETVRGIFTRETGVPLSSFDIKDENILRQKLNIAAAKTKNRDTIDRYPLERLGYAGYTNVTGKPRNHNYKLIRKDFESTLYEYIAVFADDDCNCWHVVSLGMSGLRAERDTTHKRYDAEYTMRIRCLDDEDMDEAEWANAINLVSILADEACNKERMAEDYSYVSLGFRKGMDYKRESDKVAFIIVPDARIGSVEGPFGTVHLRQAVPITRAEHQALKTKQIDVKTLYEKIGTDLTDYDRPSVI